MLLLSTWSCWEEMSDGPCIAKVLQDKTNGVALIIKWKRLIGLLESVGCAVARARTFALGNLVPRGVLSTQLAQAWESSVSAEHNRLLLPSRNLSKTCHVNCSWGV